LRWHEAVSSKARGGRLRVVVIGCRVWTSTKTLLRKCARLHGS
jgi:hypothetical protein